MTKIKIDLDEENSRYILTGDTSNLLKDYRIKSYLKTFLQSDFSNPASIIIVYDIGLKEDILNKIKELLKRYQIEVFHSDNVESSLKSYLEEERKFIEFSEKALSIKNNNCDKNEFKDFVESLKKNLPKRRLYKLQLLSAYHLTFSLNACNFSVPGSGKTSIVYGAYSYLKNLPVDDDRHVDKLLIIGPLSSFGPWEQEYFECFGMFPTSKRLTGLLSREKRIDYLCMTNTDELTLISYFGVSSVKDYLITFLKNNKTMVILDEAHHIKNIEGGVIAKDVLDLARYCKSRVVLTGTPLPNGFHDMYNLFNFIWPTKDILRFRLNQLKEMSQELDTDRIKRLIEYVSPYFVRIKKSDLELPEPIIHPPILVDMGEEQRKIYDFIEKKYIEYLQADDEKQTLKESLSRARLIRLMQTATNPSLLKKPLDEYFANQGLTNNILIDESEIIERIREYDTKETPRKFIETKNLIEEIMNRDEKVIVWTTFVQNIFDLHTYLSNNGIVSRYIYGGIPVDSDFDDDNNTREKIISDFHDYNSDFKVLIANPFSVSESISLHKVCHNAIYLERTFNAAHFIQSKDRIHRYGLKKDDKINYYFLLSSHSIDETIHDRLLFKEERMKQVIETNEIPLFFNAYDGDLGNADIRAIIDDYVKRTTSA
jgi:superfamily II DNA or RNA helicase